VAGLGCDAVTAPIAPGVRLVAADRSFAGRVDTVWYDALGRVRCITILDDRGAGWRNVAPSEVDFETHWLH